MEAHMSSVLNLIAGPYINLVVFFSVFFSFSFGKMLKFQINV